LAYPRSIAVDFDDGVGKRLLSFAKCCWYVEK